MTAPNPRLLQALSDMADVFPGARVELRTLELYASRLSDLDIDALVGAIDRLINTAKPKYAGYFPSIAEIREQVEAGGPTDGAAELAWAEVMREVRRVGWNPKGYFHNGVHHDPPKAEFTSPITKAAVDSVTWRMICLSETPEKVRDQFLWTWKNLASRMLKQAANGDPVDGLAVGSNLRALPRKGDVA
jgi:hypothetical protein